jgi:hypothetical protein
LVWQRRENDLAQDISGRSVLKRALAKERFVIEITGRCISMIGWPPKMCNRGGQRNQMAPSL